MDKASGRYNTQHIHRLSCCHAALGFHQALHSLPGAAKGMALQCRGARFDKTNRGYQTGQPPGHGSEFWPSALLPPVGVNAVVGTGLVFKPAYIPTMSFSSLLMTLMDWSINPKERLSEACLTFLNISPKSEVYPLCRDYPVLVDLSSKELVSSHFMRSHVMNFQAFKLPLVRGLSPKTNEWARYISVPHLVGTASYLLTPHQEGGLPEERFRSSSTLCVSLSAPDQDHWSIHADKKFAKIVKHLAEECLQRQEEAEDKEEAEEKEEDTEEQGGGEAHSCHHCWTPQLHCLHYGD